MSLNYNPILREVAKSLCRELRKKSTPAEVIFWELVRDNSLKGLKFYRQYPIYCEYLGKETFFIADFYCIQKKTIVEIDGRIHDYQKDHDILRTHIINSYGIQVIRFKNEEIENDIENVKRKLISSLVSTF